MVHLYMDHFLRRKEIVYYNVTCLHPILLMSKLIVYGLWADCDPCWTLATSMKKANVLFQDKD